MKTGAPTQKPVAHATTPATTRRYNTRYQQRLAKQQGSSSKDTVAKAPDHEQTAHLTGGRSRRPLAAAPKYLSSSSESSSSSDSSSVSSSSSSEASSSASRDTHNATRMRVTLARTGSSNLAGALEAANLKSPSGTRHKMGAFEVGANVKALFDTFSENCVASNDRLHASVKEGSLTPQSWAQYLTNMQEIMHAARANARRETGNVSGAYDGRLNQAAHAGRDLAKLKELGIAAPKGPTAGVAALVEHMQQNPKFGDVDAFLFYGMSLVFGGAMQRNVEGMNTETWHLDYRPTIYQYGDEANKVKTGNQYFAALEKKLKGKSAEERTALQGHIATSFKLYTAALNEIVPSEGSSAAGSAKSGILASLANLAGRLAFWR